MEKIMPHLVYRPYSPNEVVRLVNTKQWKLYIQNHIYPIDIYSSVNKKGEPIIVMVFLKDQTQEAYKLWCKYELEDNTL